MQSAFPTAGSPAEALIQSVQSATSAAREVNTALEQLRSLREKSALRRRRLRRSMVTFLVIVAALILLPLFWGGIQYLTELNKVENAVVNSNKVWNRAVGKNGDLTSLGSVYAGKALDEAMARAKEIRANQHYLEIYAVSFESFEPIDLTIRPQSPLRIPPSIIEISKAKVAAKEHWRFTLMNAQGKVARKEEEKSRVTYELEKKGGQWLVISQVHQARR